MISLIKQIRWMLILGLILESFVGFTQELAIIRDSDGIVNVRDQPNSKAHIVGKIENHQLFWVDDKDGDWWHISFFGDADQEFSSTIKGFMHAGHLQLIGNSFQLKKRKYFVDGGVIYNDSIQVEIRSQKFNGKGKKLRFHNGQLSTINGKKPWGTDGNMPLKELSVLRVNVSGRTVDIPLTAYNDLYEPDFKNLHCYIINNKTIYISMLNGDGAGGYSVIWMLVNGKYLKRTIITY